VIRLAVESEFGITLSRTHTLAVARLISHWHGQGALDLPGIKVERRGNRIYFAPSEGSTGGFETAGQEK